MASTVLEDRRTAGDPDPTEVITATLNGVTFRAGRRTIAHLIATDEALRKAGKWLRLIQPPYNSSVPASAGTHDYDGCVDVEVMGAAWEDGQQALRLHGWAAWFRPYTPGLWSSHIHMVSIGCPGPVGIYVPGQIADYYAHRTGLKGHAPDRSWHPANINSTVFDYPAWLEDQPMSPDDKKWISDLLDAKLAANNTTLVKAVWDAAIDKGGTAARAALRKVLEKVS